MSVMCLIMNGANSITAVGLALVISSIHRPI